MKLWYKCFGNVATLIRYKRTEVDGNTVGICCDGARVCRVCPIVESGGYSFKMVDGGCEVPLAAIGDCASVVFEMENGNAVNGTPLKVQRIGGSIYVCGGEFSSREEIERLNDALIFVSEVAEDALEKAKRVIELEKRLGELEKKAHSGDILR